MRTETEDKKKNSYLGFLTALGNSRQGVIGGFLVLNMAGRPVEFHCTSPVRPNRAQEILYGETLESFVCGEQIAPALVGRAKLGLTAVLTNDPNMLPAVDLLNVPLGFVFRHIPKEENVSKLSDEQIGPKNGDETGALVESTRSVASESSGEALQNDSNSEALFFYESLDVLPFVPGVDYSRWRETIRGKNRLALPTNFATDSQGKITFDECVSRIVPFLRSIDAVEPFERIRLAVEEAQKSN